MESKSGALSGSREPSPKEGLVPAGFDPAFASVVRLAKAYAKGAGTVFGDRMKEAEALLDRCELADAALSSSQGE